jgi:glycosyltransferase involved in cell wall biosynthesis
MVFFPVFLSVVLVVHNRAGQIEDVLADSTSRLSSLVSDYELVVVDNGSDDDSVAVLGRLTGESGMPNLQVYALTKEVNSDVACWVGLENAIGDFVAVIDLSLDDIAFLPAMLDKAVSGADVVFATNVHKSPQNLAYRAAYAVFSSFYRLFSGIHLAKEAPNYRVLSRRVVNFILRHPQPAITYRHLPATGGFARVNLTYSSAPRSAETRRLGESVDRGMRLLVSTTRLPMRLVTLLSLFGAGINVVYSAYVVMIGLIKADVAPGWISLSLQQSGMFFLISLVLLVLGEYILQMASLTNEGPLYHIGQEFKSVHLTRREKLNIEQAPDLAATVPSRRERVS